MSKTSIVSFATRGPPHDAGRAIADDCFPRFEAECLAGGADRVDLYTPERILQDVELNGNCVKDWGEEVAKTTEPGYASCGLGAWRFELARHALANGAEGDIVAVLDPDIKKYPTILNLCSNIKKICAAMLSWHRPADDDEVGEPWVAATEFTTPGSDFSIEQICRHDVLDFLKVSATDRKKNYLRANFIVFRICDASRAFVNELADLVLNPQTAEFLLLPGNEDAERANFSHHTAEQAVFNALFYARGVAGKADRSARLIRNNSGSCPHFVEMLLTCKPPRPPTAIETAHYQKFAAYSPPPRLSPSNTSRRRPLAIALYGQQRSIQLALSDLSLAAREGRLGGIPAEDIDFFWHTWGEDEKKENGEMSNDEIRAAVLPISARRGIVQVAAPSFYEALPETVKPLVDKNYIRLVTHGEYRYDQFKYQGPLSAMYSISAVTRMVDEYARETGVCYDAVMLFRSDFVPVSVNNLSQVISSFESLSEVSSRIAFASLHSNATLCDLLSDLLFIVPHREIGCLTGMFSNHVFQTYHGHIVGEYLRAHAIDTFSANNRRKPVAVSHIACVLNRRTNSRLGNDGLITFSANPPKRNTAQLIGDQQRSFSPEHALFLAQNIFQQATNNDATVEECVKASADALAKLRLEGLKHNLPFSREAALFAISVFEWCSKCAFAELPSDVKVKFLDEAALATFFSGFKAFSTIMSAKAAQLAPNDARLVANANFMKQ
jgi:hypothetical protein